MDQAHFDCILRMAGILDNLSPQYLPSQTILAHRENDIADLRRHPGGAFYFVCGVVSHIESSRLIIRRLVLRTRYIFERQVASNCVRLAGL